MSGPPWTLPMLDVLLSQHGADIDHEAGIYLEVSHAAAAAMSSGRWRQVPGPVRVSAALVSPGPGGWDVSGAAKLPLLGRRVIAALDSRGVVRRPQVAAMVIEARSDSRLHLDRWRLLVGIEALSAVGAGAPQLQ